MPASGIGWQLFQLFPLINSTQQYFVELPHSRLLESEADHIGTSQQHPLPFLGSAHFRNMLCIKAVSVLLHIAHSFLPHFPSGLMLMVKAGYHPSEAALSLSRLENVVKAMHEATGQPMAKEWFNTHPVHETRVASIEVHVSTSLSIEYIDILLPATVVKVQKV
jgi:hypothetical protein